LRIRVVPRPRIEPVEPPGVGVEVNPSILADLIVPGVGWQESYGLAVGMQQV